jgi:hypothetical protein
MSFTVFKLGSMAKAQLILEGDLNTRYFHSVGNGRHRKKLTHSLVQDEGTIEGHEERKSYMANYYRKIVWGTRKKRVLNRWHSSCFRFLMFPMRKKPILLCLFRG